MEKYSETGAAMAAKVTPPAAVVGANLMGYPLPDLIQWVTLVYVVVLAVKGSFDLYDYLKRRFGSEPEK